MYAMVLLPDWSCRSCTVAQQETRGCHAPALKPVEFNGEVLPRCPRRPLLERPAYYEELFWLYSNYSNGILPEGGGLDDQPHKLVAAIRCLIRARQDAEQEKDEREKRRAALRERASQVFKQPGNS